MSSSTSQLIHVQPHILHATPDQQPVHLTIRNVTMHPLEYSCTQLNDDHPRDTYSKTHVLITSLDQHVPSSHVLQPNQGVVVQLQDKTPDSNEAVTWIQVYARGVSDGEETRGACVMQIPLIRCSEESVSVNERTLLLTAAGGMADALKLAVSSIGFDYSCEQCFLAWAFDVAARQGYSECVQVLLDEQIDILGLACGTYIQQCKSVGIIAAASRLMGPQLYKYIIMKIKQYNVVLTQDTCKDLEQGISQVKFQSNCILLYCIAAWHARRFVAHDIDRIFSYIVQDRHPNDALAFILVEACKSRHVQLVSELLQAGVDPDQNGISQASSSSSHSGLRSNEKKHITGIKGQRVAANYHVHPSMVRVEPQLNAYVIYNDSRRYPSGKSQRFSGASKDAESEYPLHIAARLGYADVTQLLLSFQADADKRGGFQVTPLILALREKHAGVVELLLQAGASVVQHDQYGNTPLVLAAKSGYDNVLFKLVEGSATDVYGTLHEFCRKCANFKSPKYFKVLELLTQRLGADLTRLFADGRTPLTAMLHACQVENVTDYGGVQIGDAAGILIEHGAQTGLDAHGESPLVIACRKGYYKAVQSLISHGVDVNLCQEDGTTPLLVAVQYRYSYGKDVYIRNCRIVQALLTAGADPHMPNEEGITPLLYTILNYGRKLPRDGTSIYIPGVYDLEDRIENLVNGVEAYKNSRRVQILNKMCQGLDFDFEGQLLVLWLACISGDGNRVGWLLNHMAV